MHCLPFALQVLKVVYKRSISDGILVDHCRDGWALWLLLVTHSDVHEKDSLVHFLVIRYLELSLKSTLIKQFTLLYRSPKPLEKHQSFISPQLSGDKFYSVERQGAAPTMVMLGTRIDCERTLVMVQACGPLTFLSLTLSWRTRATLGK